MPQRTLGETATIIMLAGAVFTVPLWIGLALFLTWEILRGILGIFRRRKA